MISQEVVLGQNGAHDLLVQLRYQKSERSL